MADERCIWTREGRTQLNPKPSKGAVGREEKHREAFWDYAKGREHSAALVEVYERAYRRAGILSGNPDEIVATLPPVTPVAAKKSDDVAVAYATPDDDQTSALDGTSGQNDSPRQTDGDHTP